jgi:selenocysteine-specific elongation factor
MFVIGTAGHVDHGKSALVRALTGIDPDRLQEEKDRGMTIDLGFAWLKLAGPANDDRAEPSSPSEGVAAGFDNEVSIVDVPGHERFIKNMLAGAGGIDLALLVVAADEGVMPQTREHLAILDLLGIERGVVALTKRDLVDKDWADLVAADVEELVKGTTLAGAPIVQCSAVTREGLDTLVEVLQAELLKTQPKPDLGRPRLPIDRAFTVQGFGTVVTGTLIDGAFRVGDEVEVLPAIVGGHSTSLRSRVRGLQSHGRRVERALPGTRTAINLAGLEVEDLYRGQVVTTPGWLRPSIAVDVRLRALASLPRPLKHNLIVSFHSGSSETPAKLRLLEVDQLDPGEEGWAQVRLARPAAVVKGDRFVVRDANDTVGGGVIVETQARRHARKRRGPIESLERRLEGSPSELLLAALLARQPVEPDALIAASELGNEKATTALSELLAEGRAVALHSGEAATYLYARSTFDALASRAAGETQAFQAQHPLRPGIGKEELRSRLDVPSRVFPALLQRMAADHLLAEHGPQVSTPDWQPGLNAAQKADADGYIAALRASPYSPPVDRRPAEELVAYLADQGLVVDVGEGVVFAAGAYRDMVDRIVARMREQGKITLAEVRDMFGTSRRYCQALLEHLDQQRVTVRRGDDRILGRGASKAREVNR